MQQAFQTKAKVSATAGSLPATHRRLAHCQLAQRQLGSSGAHWAVAFTTTQKPLELRSVAMETIWTRLVAAAL